MWFDAGIPKEDAIIVIASTVSFSVKWNFENFRTRLYNLQLPSIPDYVIVL